MTVLMYRAANLVSDVQSYFGAFFVRRSTGAGQFKPMLKHTQIARFAVILRFFTACDALRTQHLRTEVIELGEYKIRAEIASTPRERERGLMYRTSIGEEEGMLFVFPKASPQAFWMKNTLIPLDVGYFDEQGFLIEYFTMTPDDGVRTYPSSEPALYALEMKAGWYAKRGLRKYTKLVFPRSLEGL